MRSWRRCPLTYRQQSSSPAQYIRRNEVLGHQLNQRFMFLADSDRRSADDPLKDRVERIVQESEARSYGSVWVTAGRMIENYVAPSHMKSAIEGVHPSATASEGYDQYGDALAATSASSTSFEVDKVKVAQQAVTSGVQLDYLLGQRVEWLVGLIKDANRTTIAFVGIRRLTRVNPPLYAQGGTASTVARSGMGQIRPFSAGDHPHIHAHVRHFRARSWQSPSLLPTEALKGPWSSSAGGSRPHQQSRSPEPQR